MVICPLPATLAAQTAWEPYNFTSGAIALTANSTITNATTTAANGPHPITLSTTMTGSTRTLILDRTGTGGGFQIGGSADYTAKSLDLQNIVSHANLTVPSTTGGADPFQLLQNNGGGLTMGIGATLSMMGGITEATPQIVDPTAITFSGNNTLFLYRAQGGNRDANWLVTDNVNVGGGSGLSTLRYEAVRGTLTVSAGNSITVGNGGLLAVDVVNSIRGFLAGNVQLHDGATLQGSINGSFTGGFIRNTTGTLTLGNGGGTLANPDDITVRGDTAATARAFNIGWAQHLRNGVARMKYANTNAANYFHVGGAMAVRPPPPSWPLRKPLVEPISPRSSATVVSPLLDPARAPSPRFKTM